MAKVPLNTRIDPELLELIRKAAKQENRTVSNLVDTALRVYVTRKRRRGDKQETEE